MKLATFTAAVLLPLFSSAQMDTLSHSLGILLAKSVQSQGLPLENPDDFVTAFKATIAGDVSAAQVAEAQANIEKYMQAKQAEQQSKASAGSAAEKAAGAKFMAENGARDGVTTTASGLQYEVLTPGKGGTHPTASSTVEVHYTGKLLDGTTFDSSVDGGTPISFPLNGVIAGWTEGVQLMTEGAKYRFWIPSDLAYGERGAGADIPPGATLMFDVELLEIK